MKKLTDANGSIINNLTTSAEYVDNSQPQVLYKTEKCIENEAHGFRMYLYMWEALKLVKHLNSKMKIGKSALSLVFNPNKSIENEDEDLF